MCLFPQKLLLFILNKIVFWSKIYDIKRLQTYKIEIKILCVIDTTTKAKTKLQIKLLVKDIHKKATSCSY